MKADARPMTDTLMRRPKKLPCADGWLLDVEVVTGPSPRAVAVVGHAMMVDRRTMDARGDGLVSSLARSGIAVVWPDLRGHGQSGPRANEGGDWTYDDLLEQDTPALLSFAQAEFPTLPLFAVGHSLFGHVALAYLARHADSDLARSVRGLVLLAANTWMRECEPSKLVWAKKRALIEAMWAVSRIAGRFPSRRLRAGSNDEALSYVRQFMGWVRRGGWTALDGFSYRDALPRVTAPLLAVAAEDDRLLAAVACLDRYYALIPNRQMLLAGTGKQASPPGWSRLPLSFDPGHMDLATDERSAPVWQRVAEFILREAAR